MCGGYFIATEGTTENTGLGISCDTRLLWALLKIWV